MSGFVDQHQRCYSGPDICSDTLVYQWALDAHIIAPGPDYKWHVSKLLDERVTDSQPLLALEGKTLSPTDKAMWPKKEALEWRLEQLLLLITGNVTLIPIFLTSTPA